ncbi:MAG: imidazole glycerol phosphate synthase subunit HisH [Syntrophomonadaceae bacterium]|nr:imidazole glycerol phosphate synthase subunit HisH [Syntrophomonadaceae bacterium]
MIAIIDYGMGNLASVNNAFLKLGYETITTSAPETILAADKVVLPGVGAFADAIANLRQAGLDQTIQSLVEREIPLLGICLGLQLLFSVSYENGVHQGLGIIPGQVKKFELPPQYKVPQMGWNSITVNPRSQLLAGIPSGSYFYFVHSYYVVPEDESVVAARTEYGIDFVSAIEKGNLFATQFHPEKSSELGLRVLRNFAELLS